MSQKFCNILIVRTSSRGIYYMTEAVQAEPGTMIESIVVGGTLSYDALLHPCWLVGLLDLMAYQPL